MLIQQNAVLFLAVSLPALVMCGVPHSHGVKKGHAEREDDGAYRFLATFSFRRKHLIASSSIVLPAHEILVTPAIRRPLIMRPSSVLRERPRSSTASRPKRPKPNWRL